ncbi:MocR-like pyridoxine biosynthesis transcription factor PdxR [Sunxiuqinia sp. A32]|uniref:MocR-like pyridoxine biosynthesis transcription factor PdxR n=1 Tax=Sunxiuqinia sp. A32 TaxID=3461496 RepID=UPI0040466D96
MILIKVDKYSKLPLFQQIFNQLKSLIERGTILQGEQLPSTRKLADLLGVNRTTVYRAYEELWASGYTESSSGGYTIVRKRQYIGDSGSQKSETLINWNDRFSAASKKLQQKKSISHNTTKDILDFTQLSPDHHLMPIEDFRKCMNISLKSDGVELLDYAPTLGYPPLRKYLPKILGEHGIQVSHEEIALTNGMQNGLELILRLLTNPGDEIITETPTYASLISLTNYLGLSVTSITMNEKGMDLNQLEQQLKKGKARLIYTMPTFHNPTGISTSQAHREQLMALCEKYQTPIIEDGFEEEMKYFGKAVLPIKAMDKNQMVIYLGTFSKVLFPGIRVGWIAAAPEIIQRIRILKQTTELSGSSINQAAIDLFCKKGYYELHKKRIHRIYRKRMQTLLQSCREQLDPNKISFTRPDGGYLIWFTLLDCLSDEETVIHQLLKSGIAVTSGSRFFPEKRQQISFRLSIAKRNEEEITNGIQRIAETIQTLKFKHDTTTNK